MFFSCREVEESGFYTPVIGQFDLWLIRAMRNCKKRLVFQETKKIGNFISLSLLSRLTLYPMQCVTLCGRVAAHLRCE